MIHVFKDREFPRRIKMIEANSMEQAWERLDERLKQRKQRNCALDYEFGYFI